MVRGEGPRFGSRCIRRGRSAPSVEFSGMPKTALRRRLVAPQTPPEPRLPPARAPDSRAGASRARPPRRRKFALVAAPRRARLLRVPSPASESERAFRLLPAIDQVLRDERASALGVPRELAAELAARLVAEWRTAIQ